MIKSNILTLALLLVIGGGAVAIHFSGSAQAQGTGARRWEYCAITDISSRWRNGADHVIESFGVITYFGTTGIRIEEVVGGEVSGNPVFPLQAVTRKAIAKLGAEGWEIVGNENLDLDVNSKQVGGSLLFKRPL